MRRYGLILFSSDCRRRLAPPAQRRRSPRLVDEKEYMGGLIRPRPATSGSRRTKPMSATGRPSPPSPAKNLGKRWILNQRTKKYLEESISAPAGLTHQGREIPDPGIRWDYEPVYEWTAKETGETADIDGRKCRKVVLTAEADYASETREIWVRKTCSSISDITILNCRSRGSSPPSARFTRPVSP